MNPPSRADRARALRNWLVPATLLAVAPKCLLCLLGYAGLAGGLGWGGAEICGVPDGGTAAHWTIWLAAPGLALGLATGFTCGRSRGA